MWAPLQRERLSAHSPRGCTGAAAAARDHWIGWTAAQRQAHLGRVLNNARFLTLPWVQVNHLASKVLALAARQVAVDFTARYGEHVVLLETLVETPRFSGACYRAANWQYLAASMRSWTRPRCSLRSPSSSPPPRGAKARQVEREIKVVRVTLKVPWCPDLTCPDVTVTALLATEVNPSTGRWWLTAASGRFMGNGMGLKLVPTFQILSNNSRCPISEPPLSMAPSGL